jgi:hypothetical protein
MDNGYLIKKYEKLQNKLSSLLSFYETYRPFSFFFRSFYLSSRVEELQKEIKEIRRML